MTDPHDVDAALKRVRSGRPAARLRALVKKTGCHICWICGAPIDMGLPPTNRMGWTMDHVIPVSIRPDLAEDIGNIREAHRVCNSKRGSNINHHTQGNRASRDY